MPGLTFEDGPTPDPQAPLGPWFAEWVDTLLARRSIRTVNGYVADAAVFGVELLGVVGREVPGVLDQPGALTAAAGAGDVRRLAAGGVVGLAYVRARAVCDALVLADLAPRNLGRAYDRAGAQRATASVRRLGSSWASLCRFLVRREVLATNPMDAEAVERPSAPRGVPSPLSYEEMERLFAVVTTVAEGARKPWPARDLALAATFLGTGIRLAEALGARIGDLQALDVAPRLRVTGKGAKTRVVPVHVEAAAALRAYLDDRELRLGRVGGDDPLFVRSDGGAFTPSALRRLVESWYARAGVRRHPGASVHALRHTWATTALDSGASIVEVQELLGHASLETTKRYLAAVAGGLDGLAAGHPTRALLRRALEAR